MNPSVVLLCANRRHKNYGYHQRTMVRKHIPIRAMHLRRQTAEGTTEAGHPES